MNVRRVPIALRLFLTVLLTTLLIATISLGILHWTMQKNFARYVADVEMQKLDRLIANLGNVYSVYHDWGNAIQAQILQIEGTAAADDYDRLSQWWLRRQYDIALQQRYFNDHTLLSLSPTLAQNSTEIKSRQIFNEEELRILKQNLPLRDVCMQIKTHMDHPSRLQMIHILFGLSQADGHVHPLEVKVIHNIADYMGVSGKDFDSIQAMFYEDTTSAYKILEISPEASDNEVKKSYRKMAAKFHPDKVHHLGLEFQKMAEEKFKTLNYAYTKIKKERNPK